MEVDIFPKGISKDSKDKLLGLGETIFGKDRKDLTKSDIKMLVQMDMKMIISKLSLSRSGTRTTSLQYNTNNYFVAMDINISGVFEIVNTYLETVPDDKLIDEYLLHKNTIYNLIRVKYASAEEYLQNLLNTAMKKDNCPTPGRGSKDE